MPARPALHLQDDGQDRAPSRTRPRWTGWLVVVMTASVLLYGIDLVFHPLSPGVSDLFQKFAAAWIYFGAAALCLQRGRTARTERAAWWLLASAMALWGAGASYYSLFVWTSEAPPVPSGSDAFWLAFYPPAYAALYMLLRRRAGTPARGVWLDALVSGLGVGGAAAALVFGVVLDHTDGSAAATATNLAYPIGDLGLLVLVVAGITVTGWRGSGAWRWIASAFLLFAVADSIYLVQVANGDFVVGGVLDVGWPAAAVLVGLAAWRREALADASTRAGGMIVVPALCGLGALVLLNVDHFVATNGLALVLASASISIILLRLYLTVRDNERMLVTSRREASTDTLTGLGNRRKLASDLAAHLEELDPERPLLLALFDLDGFKHYNDTFGHVAGDQLLERLSARLGEVLDGRGTAYRMGGDEFCALWTLPDSRQAPAATMEAVAALTEHGVAFAIECSYGSVLLPEETSQATEALRIADGRMYIRKGSGRASAGRQSADVLLGALSERDAELRVHMDGVADLACATAQRLGVASELLETTRQTALLHDVGKVAIPDAILNKPGALSPSEWAFIQRHTIIGERIIAAAPALAAVAQLVRSTHERYDGDGYPDSLAGADIPLTARIVAVCDAFHSMVTKRAYRDACSRSAAVAELRRCAGSQFDPDVVEAFVEALHDPTDRKQAEIESRRLSFAVDGA